MIQKLFNISGMIDKYRLEIIESIKAAADQLSIPFFIVGATARDIILEFIYNKKVFRATSDIDFGVNVNDWGSFNNLISLLTKENKFVRNKNIGHRLLFKEVYPVDIVPFGKIASKEGIFEWPNENKAFTVLGFEEAYKNSDLVKVRNNPEVIVNLATAHSLAVLKIISWNERYPERLRDASDLLLIIESYLEAGNQERLFEEEEDLVDNNFNFTIAGARLLGRDIAKSFNEITLIFVLDILEKETGEKLKYRLVEDMLKTKIMKEDSDFEFFLKILDSLKSGIQERYKK